MYIQDILVCDIYQGKGIGRQLIAEFMNKYENIRQKVLITDKTLKTMNIYRNSTNLDFFTKLVLFFRFGLVVL
jgi:GNAT superfamily N-acetyltransferase